MIKSHMKRFSTFLIIRALQIKTTLRHPLTPARMAINKKKTPQTLSPREGVGRRESSYTVGGNVNWYSHYREQCGGSLKNKIELP